MGDRRFIGSIQQTAHYATQNDFPVLPFNRNIILSMNNPVKRSNSQKCQEYFRPKTTWNTDTFIDRSNSSHPYGDDHWPVAVTSKTYFRGVLGSTLPSTSASALVTSFPASCNAFIRFSLFEAPERYQFLKLGIWGLHIPETEISNIQIKLSQLLLWLYLSKGTLGFSGLRFL